MLPVLDRVRGVSGRVIASPLLTAPTICSSGAAPDRARSSMPAGGPASVEAGSLGEWRGKKACCAHLPRRAALEPAFAGLARHDVRALHPDSHTTDASRLGVGEAVDLLDDSPTVRLEHLDLASDDQLATRPDPAVTVPATKRFAAWSRRYLILVASADALVGGIAAAVPASISNTLSGQHAVVATALPCRLGRLARRDRSVPWISA